MSQLLLFFHYLLSSLPGSCYSWVELAWLLCLLAHLVHSWCQFCDVSVENHWAVTKKNEIWVTLILYVSVFKGLLLRQCKGFATLLWLPSVNFRQFHCFVSCVERVFVLFFAIQLCCIAVGIILLVYILSSYFIIQFYSLLYILYCCIILIL